MALDPRSLLAPSALDHSSARPALNCFRRAWYLLTVVRGPFRKPLSQVKKITSIKIITVIINLTVLAQARRKQFRVGPAKIDWTAKGASKLEGGGGGGGGMLPWEILKVSFSKMHIWRILRENLKRKNGPKLMVKVVRVLM